MEGTAETINQVITETPVMKPGDKFKITGGKYKKFGFAVLKTKNATYSDCELPEDMCEKHEQINRVVKIKNDYLLPENPILVEMPDADQLEVVPDIEEWEKANVKEPISKSEKDLVMEILQSQEEVVGKLEVSDTKEYLCDNITNELPTIDEALAIKEENKNLRNDVLMLNKELNFKCRELAIALEERLLDKKKLDYLRHVLENI